jgi:hypothetical protein
MVDPPVGVRTSNCRELRRLTRHSATVHRIVEIVCMRFGRLECWVLNRPPNREILANPYVAFCDQQYFKSMMV